MTLELKSAITVKGFSRQQDVILSDTMDLVIRNASREELLEFFITKFKSYSMCTSIFVIEALPPSFMDKMSEWRLRGLFQAGIQPKRWKNFCDYLSGIQKGEHWIVDLVTGQRDEQLISRIWAFDPINEIIFDDIKRSVDIEKSSWASILLLPTPSAQYPARLIVVTYESGQTEEDSPRGGEQDWRLLLLFRQTYNLSLFELRREARRIIDHRKELLRDLAPSIIHHEIYSRITNSNNTIEELNKIISDLSDEASIKLIGLTEALSKDILFLKRITHSLMGLQRRATIERVSLKQEFELIKDLTFFRFNKIGGILKIVCPDDLTIETDSALLLHILVNLVNNSVDAMGIKKTNSQNEKFDFHPCLIIEAKKSENPVTGDEIKSGIMVFVSDNGTGIPAEGASRIFEIGFTTKRDGHGLGLPISHLIAGFLGGVLELIDSTGVEGATFKLFLPFSAPAAEDIQREMEVVSQNA